MFILAEMGQENIVGALLDFRSNFINWVLLVIFLVWVSRKFLAPFIAQYQQAINSELDLAVKTRLEAQSSLALQKQKIEKAEQEAEQIVIEAKHAAQRMSEDLKQQSEREIADLRKKFAAAAENEKQAAILEMRAIVAKAAIKLTEENLGSVLNDNYKNKIANEFMGELSNLGSSRLAHESVKNQNDRSKHEVAKA